MQTMTGAQRLHWTVHRHVETFFEDGHQPVEHGGAVGMTGIVTKTTAYSLLLWYNERDPSYV